MVRNTFQRRLGALMGLIAVIALLALPASNASAAPEGPGLCLACYQNCYIWFNGFGCCIDHHDGSGACNGQELGGRCILSGAGCLVVVVTP